jgi:uncharacterized protein YkwD
MPTPELRESLGQRALAGREPRVAVAPYPIDREAPAVFSQSGCARPWAGRNAESCDARTQQIRSTLRTRSGRRVRGASPAAASLRACGRSDGPFPTDASLSRTTSHQVGVLAVRRERGSHGQAPGGLDGSARQSKRTVGERGLSRALLLSLALLVAVPGLAHAEPSDGRLADLVNAERARHGLPVLHPSTELAAAAAAYAAAMADGGFFGHRAPDGGTLVTRAEAAGYRDWAELGENLAGGTAAAEAVVAAWMASPSHRANLLSPLVRDAGAGYVAAPRSPLDHYWVLKLGSRLAGWVPLRETVPYLYTPGRPALLPTTPRR